VEITRDGTVMVTNWVLCCAYRWQVTVQEDQFTW